jgi:hypothetical protein
MLEILPARAQDIVNAQDALVTQDAAVRAVALRVGYQLPADCTDPDLIQRDISANMRRSVEACLEVGRGLSVLKAACGHGNFMARLDVLGMEANVAGRFMGAASKFSNSPSSAILKAIGNQSKLFEMLVLDDDQIEEFELTGQSGDIRLDQIAAMSVKELRAALKEAKAEAKANQELMDKKNASIDQLKREKKRIQAAPASEVLADLQKEATALMNDALGAVRGGLRQALIALDAQGTGDHNLFMAGLVGQITHELTALREEFNLPDVSNAADAQLAAEVGEWSKA